MTYLFYILAVMGAFVVVPTVLNSIEDIIEAASLIIGLAAVGCFLVLLANLFVGVLP